MPSQSPDFFPLGVLSTDLQDLLAAIHITDNKLLGVAPPEPAPWLSDHLGSVLRDRGRMSLGVEQDTL